MAQSGSQPAATAPGERMVITTTAVRKRLLHTVVSCLVFLVFIGVFADGVTRDPTVVVDFHAFYVAGYLARTNPSHLYDAVQQARLQDTSLPLPYYHPAYEALLFAPFTYLTYQHAYQAFIGFNVVLLGIIAMLLKELRTPPIPLLSHFPELVLFTFLPVLITVLNGQDPIVFLLLCCCCWRLYARHENFWAGCLLGLMLFRFQLALPLLGLLLLQRRRHLLTGFVGSALLVTSISFAMVGMSGTREMLQLLSSASLSRDHGSAIQDAMAVHPLSMPNLFGLLYVVGLHAMQPRTATAFVLVLSAALVLWTAYRNRRLQRDSDIFATALLCSMLVSYHMHLHDLSLLVLPLVLLRTRTALFLGLLTYALACALPAVGGRDSFCLLALPMLLLLFFGWRRSAAAEAGACLGAVPA